MVNRYRGEVDIVLDDKNWTLCLTLGALAELEEHFSVNSIVELAERLGNPLSAKDLLAIIFAGFKGGGYDFSIAEIAEMRSEKAAAGYADIVAKILQVTFATDG